MFFSQRTINYLLDGTESRPIKETPSQSPPCACPQQRTPFPPCPCPQQQRTPSQPCPCPQPGTNPNNEGWHLSRPCDEVSKQFIHNSQVLIIGKTKASETNNRKKYLLAWQKNRYLFLNFSCKQIKKVSKVGC